MDTVFPPDHEFQMCREEGGLLFGPGTCDMKGGLGVIVYALMALHEAKALDMMNIVVILNGDEEIGSVTSQSLFEQERENAAACLAAECAGQNGEIVVSRNGKMGARLDCYGEDRHVSGGSHDKASAILELSRQIIALEELNASLPGVSVNVGRAEGGLGPSTVPGHAYALLDVRWTDEKHRPILEDAIAKNLPRHSQPGCRSTFTVLNSRPAMPQHQQTESLFRLIHETSHSLGQSINPEHRRGTSDVNYFGAAGVAAADGFGPVGYKDHTADEHIEIESLGGRTSLLAHVLLDLCQEQ